MKIAKTVKKRPAQAHYAVSMKTSAALAPIAKLDLSSQQGGLCDAP
jgi:hypothetical protein